MSIPVFEQCGHRTQTVSPSKARRWLSTRPADWQPVNEDDLDRGIIYYQCLVRVDIPTALLAAIVTNTQAPTRRRIHPWINQKTLSQAVKAELLEDPKDGLHGVALTDKGQQVLQTAYRKLLYKDIDRGLELMGAFASLFRDAARARSAAADDQPWDDAIQAAWETLDEKDMPLPYDVFAHRLHDVPARMLKTFLYVEPAAAERLLDAAVMDASHSRATG